MDRNSSKDHKQHRFFASCPRGLEELLVTELTGAGVGETRATAGGVQFGPDLEAAYRACLWSRIVSRVLLALAEVPARDADQLHASVMELAWEQHVPPGATIAVDFIGTSEALRNTLFGARRVKDGIVDRLRAQRGTRPDVDPQDPDVRISAYLHRDRVALGIDLSGAAHRRGYRGESGAAPLKENLAAALLLRAGWPQIAARGGAFYDPMCGSGTLPVEAASIAAGTAPGEARALASPRWSGHDEALWARLRHEARATGAAGVAALPPIAGADADARVLAHARATAERAGLGAHIAFAHQALAGQARDPKLEGAPGLLACNPPWGERLGAGEALQGLYAELGELVREQYPEWRAAILTLEEAPVRELGLPVARRYRLRNGPLDCVLLVYDPDSRAARRLARPPVPPAAVSVAEAAPAPLSEGATMLANRLRKNLRRLRGWLAQTRPECYRVYDADIPEYALAVDRYADWLHVAEYAPPKTVDPARAKERLAEARAALMTVFELPGERIVLKTRERQRGTRQYQRLAREQRFLSVREGPAQLLVNLHDYLDTGLFLDHRPARRMIAELAAGRRFLNLFCYTGSASVFAALGGARRSLGVDLSATYLGWAERNLALNGFSPPEHRCERADCLQWLASARAGEWDLVFLDPPSFSNSASMRTTLDVQRDHVELVRAAVRVLAPGGVLLFSTNRHGFRLDREALADLRIEDLGGASVDPDFAREPPPHRLFRIAGAQS